MTKHLRGHLLSWLWHMEHLYDQPIKTIGQLRKLGDLTQFRGLGKQSVSVLQTLLVLPDDTDLNEAVKVYPELPPLKPQTQDERSGNQAIHRVEPISE